MYQTSGRGIAASPRQRRIARVALGMVLALLVQFALGTAVNLFVTIPAHHPGAQPAEYFSGAARSVAWAITHSPPALAVHATLGLVLIIGALALIAFAARGKRRGLTGASVLGAIFILGAAFNGASFLNYNHDLSSLLMALLFAAATATYTTLAYAAATPRHATTTIPPPAQTPAG